MQVKHTRASSLAPRAKDPFRVLSHLDKNWQFRISREGKQDEKSRLDSATRSPKSKRTATSSSKKELNTSAQEDLSRPEIFRTKRQGLKRSINYMNYSKSNHNPINLLDTYDNKNYDQYYDKKHDYDMPKYIPAPPESRIVPVTRFNHIIARNVKNIRVLNDRINDKFSVEIEDSVPKQDENKRNKQLFIRRCLYNLKQDKDDEADSPKRHKSPPKTTQNLNTTDSKLIFFKRNSHKPVEKKDFLNETTSVISKRSLTGFCRRKKGSCKSISTCRTSITKIEDETGAKLIEGYFKRDEERRNAAKRYENAKKFLNKTTSVRFTDKVADKYLKYYVDKEDLKDQDNPIVDGDTEENPEIKDEKEMSKTYMTLEDIKQNNIALPESDIKIENIAKTEVSIKDKISIIFSELKEERKRREALENELRSLRHLVVDKKLT